MNYSKFKDLLRRSPEKEKFCIAKRRLDPDNVKLTISANKELMLLNYLMGGDDSLENALLHSIFYVGNLKNAPADTKDLARKVSENKDIAKIILRTLFQYFGTNGGSYHIGEMNRLSEKYRGEVIISSDSKSKLKIEITNLEAETKKRKEELENI